MPLRRVTRLANGGTPTSDSEYWGGAVPWATPVDLARVDGGELTQTDRTLTPLGLRAGSASVPGGSVIVSTRAPIGYTVVVRTATAFNQGCRGLVPARSLLNARYLQYWLQSVRGDLRGAGTGSTFQELASETLLATQLPLPPVHEQRRIANFLDEQVAGLDRATIAAGEMTELLEERARADLISAVLAFGDQSRVKSPVPWAPSLPKHWPVVKLNLIARMGSGHTPSRSSPELWLNPTISWLTTNDVHRFRRDEIDELDAPALSISEEGLANSAAVLHPAGTVALSRTASAGFSIVMGQAMATSQDFVTWTCGPLLLPHYLLAVLRASRQDLLGRLAMGSTHKTIYFPDLEAIRVPLPPIEEQDAAVQQVRELSAFHRAVRERLTDLRAVLEERKRALITACVTGEFDVSTASDRAGDAALAGVRV